MARPVYEVLRDEEVLESLRTSPSTFHFPNGATFRVLVHTYLPFLKVNYDGGCSAAPGGSSAVPGGASVTAVAAAAGPVVSLLETLGETLNFTYTLVAPSDRQWGWRSANGTWNGMFGELLKGNADVILAPARMDGTRSSAFDFCSPLFASRLVPMGLRGSSASDPWTLFSVLPNSVMLCVAATLLLLYMLLNLPALLHRGEDSAEEDATDENVILASGNPKCRIAKEKTSKSRNREVTSKALKPENRVGLERVSAFQLCGYALGQSAPLPMAGWRRVALLPALLGLQLLAWMYNGALLSRLAVRGDQRPVQSLEDAVASKGLALGAFPGIVWSAQEAPWVNQVLRSLRAAGRLKVFPYHDEMRGARERFDVEPFVFFEEDNFLKRFMEIDYLKTKRCRFYLGQTPMLSLPNSIALPKGSPLRLAFNRR